MTRAAAVLATIAVLVLGGWWLLGGGPAGGNGEPPAAGAAASGAGPATRGAVAPDSPAAAAAMAAGSNPGERTEAPAGAGVATLLVRDDQGRPIGGALVRSLRADVERGVTDAEGRIRWPARAVDQVAVLATGHLFRQTAATPGETAEVTLLADRWSLRGRFRFERPDGTLAQAVRARLQPRQEPDGMLQVPRAVAAAGERAVAAFREHAMICAVLPGGVPAWHLGELSRQRVYRLGGVAEVSFAEPGLYELDCTADGEFVARALFQAEAIVDEPLVVPLRPGRMIDGAVVRSDTGAPIADASVVAAGDPDEPQARTDAQGRFRVGPFAEGTVRLELRHPDMQPLQLGPVAADGRLLQAAMMPLPNATLRGTVRARPDLRPLAGATVSVVDGADQQRVATADGEGWFTLSAPTGEMLRLSVSAKGFATHRELLEAGGEPLPFDLWPAEPAERVRTGISGLLRGRVVDARGEPVAGMVVQWQPDAPRPPDGITGRRIVEGAAPPVGLRATSGEDGSFTLETVHPGLGRLVPIDGAPRPEAGGLRLEVILGAERPGLTVTCRRPTER